MKQPSWILEANGSLGEFDRKTAAVCRHNALNLALFGVLASLLVSLIFLSPYFPFLVFVPLGGLFMGFIIYSFFILVVHEAAHNMFLLLRKPSAQLFWNRFFGWMICIPFFSNYEMNWEKAHNQHHRHPLEANDTEVCDPALGKTLLKKVAKLLLIPGYNLYWSAIRGKGPNFNCASKEENFSKNAWVVVSGVLFWGIVIALMERSYYEYFQNPWQPILSGSLAMIMGANWASALMILRQGAEHGGRVGIHNPTLRSKTSLSRGLYFLFPWGIGYHFEHHLRPTIPWYRLTSAHKVIRGFVPEEKQPDLYNDGAKKVLSCLKG